MKITNYFGIPVINAMSPLDIDRGRVNHETKTNPYPCLAVSIEFFDEMLGAVPPAFHGKTDNAGCYSMIQVGEPTDHNAQGKPLYETFQCMNQAAIEQQLADSRMEVGQWYFVGLRTQHETLPPQN